MVRTPKNIQVQYLDRMYKNSDHRVVNANGEFQDLLETLHFGFERWIGVEAGTYYLWIHKFIFMF